MMGSLLVLAAMIAAQVLAAVVMLYLGRALQVAWPDAGPLAWCTVGLAGILASIAFLNVAVNWQRWIQWPR